MHNRTSDHSDLPTRREEAAVPCLRRRDEKPKARLRKPMRGLPRNWRCSAVGIAVLLLLGQAPVFAATIVVNSECTLGKAIASANNDSSRSCAPGRGPDRIVLPQNRQLVLRRVNNTSFGPTGLPVIRTHISIIGNGSTVIRHPQAARFRIFAVARSGRLTLNRLILRGGFAPRLGGGGIRSLGPLTVFDVALDGNRAFGSGGGFWAQDIVTIVRSRFSRNRSFCAPISAPAACSGGGGFYATG
jgi:hypothetical protein